MRTVLYLRSNEKKMFDALPSELRQKWESKIVEETADNFETPEELEVRVARYSKNPTLAPFLEEANGRLQKGEDLGSVLGSMPEKALKVFIDAIGNSGICALIEIAFLSGKVDEAALTGIATLSDIRHRQMMHSSVLA
ncbi:MAG: hypothetical protein HOO67_02775 [Candidatus Peribacteraceae bacterium]|nr:hypothetical protein [Candidatus Peribacteraceae bacterium]